MHSSALEAISSAFSVLFMGRNFIRLLGGLWVTISIAAVSVVLSVFFVYKSIIASPAQNASFKNVPVSITIRAYLLTLFHL